MSNNVDDFLGVDNQSTAPSGQPPADLRNIQHKYPALRAISTIYKVLAYIFGIAAIIGLFWGISQLDSRYDEMAGIVIVYSLFVGFLMVIGFLAFSEGIKLFIDIEENTRMIWKKLK